LIFIWNGTKRHYIIKKLTLKTKGKNSFHWKVKALTLQDFEGLMEEAGIYLLDILETINWKNSTRMKASA
jgi:hypothetical protein